MKVFSFLLAMFITFLGIQGCAEILNGVDGSGDAATETRQLATFHSIVIKGSMDVKLHQGSVQELSIRTDSNILPIITTTVENGVLTIDSKKGYNTNIGVNVNITIPEVQHLRNEGSGDITANEVIVSQLLQLDVDGSGSILLPEVKAVAVSASIAGSGDITLKGVTQSLTGVITGSGSINAPNLVTQSLSATIKGSGNCEITVERTLDVDIEGSGSVLYRGNPETRNVHLDGSGTVSKLD